MLSVAPDGGNRRVPFFFEREQPPESAAIARERSRRAAENLDADESEGAGAVLAGLELDSRPTGASDHVDRGFSRKANL